MTPQIIVTVRLLSIEPAIVPRGTVVWSLLRMAWKVWRGELHPSLEKVTEHGIETEVKP